MNIVEKNIKSEIVLIVVSIVVLASLFVFYFYMKNGKEDIKVLTEQEKMEILNSLASSSSDNQISPEEKAETLKLLESNKPSNLSDAEKAKILDSLSR